MAVDAVTAIMNDHRLMEQLFERLKDQSEDRTALVMEVVARLHAHATAEEEHVYTAIIEADPPEQGEVYHGIHEHHEAEEQLARLRAADPASPQFDSVLAEFVEAVKHHVEEEETKILPELKSAVDEATLTELGRLFEKRRQAELRAAGMTDRSGNGHGELTRDELYQQAQDAGIPGRSSMTKQELMEALETAKS